MPLTAASSIPFGARHTGVSTQFKAIATPVVLRSRLLPITADQTQARVAFSVSGRPPPTATTPAAPLLATPMARQEAETATVPSKGSCGRWAIVLAGGSGTRLAGLTRDPLGRPVPKQYCSLRNGRSLLGDALARAGRAVPHDQILVVVAAEHEHHWLPLLADLPRGHLLVQPANRGTAPGILLPLLAVCEADHSAQVTIIPSDHFVAQEDVLVASLAAALKDITAARAGIELLGIEPDHPETDYGWIQPMPGPGAVRPVAAFVEKPSWSSAQELQRRGAVWNSFLLAARATTLLDLFSQRMPGLVRVFQRQRPHAAADGGRALYQTLASADFSRDLLQGAEAGLQLRVVPSCGWTDLGTPQRVASCLEQHVGPGQAGGRGVALDLAEALARSRRGRTQRPGCHDSGLGQPLPEMSP